jgi:hypothetical protein
MENISGNFVFDMDEVLVDISPLQYKYIRYNWRKYNAWFRDLGTLSEKEVLDRPLFYMNEWLLKDEILKSDEKNKVIAFIRKMLFDDFFSQDIYSKVKPTKFAEKTIMNKSFMDHKRVNKVYILSRCTGPEMEVFKKKFVAKHFSHPKVEFLCVKINEKKSDVLKKHDVSWNLFVDDEISNIIDFVENYDIKGKEFLIPKTGYNKMPLVLDILIKEKGATYSYFNKEE